MFGTSKAAPLGLQQARLLIGGLAKGDPCSAKATAAVRVALAAVERAAAAGDRPKAKRLLAQVIGSIKARRVVSASTASAVAAASAATRSAARPARHAKKCPIDRAPKVRPQDADKVGDYLETAKTAQKVKDDAAAAKAIDGARDAYGGWAGEQMAGGGARTVGDSVSIARGGQMLGNEGVAATSRRRTSTKRPRSTTAPQRRTTSPACRRRSPSRRRRAPTSATRRRGSPRSTRRSRSVWRRRSPRAARSGRSRWR